MLDLPPGLIAIPLEGSGGCELVLTTEEYIRGIRRGKYFRRREQERQRAEKVQATQDAVPRYPRLGRGEVVVVIDCERSRASDARAARGLSQHHVVHVGDDDRHVEAEPGADLPGA